MTSLGAASAAMAGYGAPAAEGTSPMFYALEIYNLQNGTQPARIHEHFKNAGIPALARAGAGPVLVMDAVVAPHIPRVAYIVGCASLENLWSIHTKVLADSEFLKQFAAWDHGQEPPFESQETILLQATKYSPELVPDKEPRKSPRVFELRVYHSPSWHQLEALHGRFAGAEVNIFHRSGIFPILYSSTVIGPAMPNLTYVIPFDNLDAREKAWAKFGADPEWVKVRKESIDKHGEIVSAVQISLYKATPYSPVG